jgi:hypothetical protein
MRLSDLVWVGNTLYPRWYVLLVITGVIIAATLVIALVIRQFNG